MEWGAPEKVSIGIAALLVKAQRHQRTSSSSHPALPLLVAAGACGTAGGVGGGAGRRTNPHLFWGGGGGGRGVDCAADRRSDPAALFEQQVKGRAVPQCIVCPVVFGGVLADADGGRSEPSGEGEGKPSRSSLAESASVWDVDSLRMRKSRLKAQSSV